MIQLDELSAEIYPRVTFPKQTTPTPFCFFPQQIRGFKLMNGNPKTKLKLQKDLRK